MCRFRNRKSYFLSNNQTPWPESASELHRKSDRRLSAKLVPTFAGGECHVVSVTDLWSRGQSSWLQIQRSGFDSWRYQIFWEVVGLERGPLSLVSTIEGLLERKSSGSGLESRVYCRRNPSRWPRGILYPQKLTLNSATSRGRSVGIVRSLTQATEFSFYISTPPYVFMV
jgi:hypothetical protein